MATTDLVISKCLKHFDILQLPADIKVETLDSVDFFNLSKQGIPEEYTINVPVLTDCKDDEITIYINLTELNEKEYYVLELFTFQLFKQLMEKDEQIISLRSNAKNSFIMKNVESGCDVFLEFIEILLSVNIVKAIYDDAGEKKHPYTASESNNIGLKILKSALSSKEGDERISSIVYSLARLKGFSSELGQIAEISEEKIKLLIELSDLLLESKVDTVSASQLNKIGRVCKKI